MVGDKARRFVLEGMDGLHDRRTEARGAQAPGYPDAVAGYILSLKQLYPPIHLREIVRIVHRKFGYKTNHHTLKRFLAPYATPHQLELALPPFATFADAYLGLGTSLVTEKNYAAAIPPLEMAVKLQPDNPAGHYSLATAYARTGRKEDAEREFALHQQLAEKAGGQGAQNPQ